MVAIWREALPSVRNTLWMLAIHTDGALWKLVGSSMQEEAIVSFIGKLSVMRICAAVVIVAGLSLPSALLSGQEHKTYD